MTDDPRKDSEASEPAPEGGSQAAESADPGPAAPAVGAPLAEANATAATTGGGNGFTFRHFAGFESDTKIWWRDRAIVLVLAALLILPFLGTFGLWDPWETHYGEVGRQITERNDWISTWWGSHWQDKGGSQEGAYFYSKPILLMWMMAMGMEVFGINEWGIRIGVALVALLGIVLVYSMGASVWSRRTGGLMAGVLATSPFWFFLSRQAQTDMPFVGLMTVGLCFFMMAVFGKDRDRPADLFSYALTFGWLGVVAIPQLTLVLAGLGRFRGAENAVMKLVAEPPVRGVVFTGVLLGLSALMLVAALWLGRSEDDRGQRLRRRLALGSLGVLWAPLLLIGAAAMVVSTKHLVDLNGWFVWGGVQAAIYATCLGLATYWSVAKPIVERRRVYLLAFYIFIGLATLAKGLLGFMLPGAFLFFYILLTREWRLLKDVELLRGIPIFIAVSFPWYAAMLIRHTQGFWNRFFVHDHFKRLASGVHQIDTGSFEHFLHWLGYGLFPWAAWIPAAFAKFFGGSGLEGHDDRRRATLFLVLWATISFTLFTLSSTKFHHYIFPAVPALAMLVALLLDDALDAEMPQPWPLFLLAPGLLALIAWDIIDDPQIPKNLFTYKYDREWNNAGWDANFRWTVAAIMSPAALGSLVLLVRNRVARRLGVAAILVSGFALGAFFLNVYMPRLSETWSQKGLWDYYYSVCKPTDGPPGADPRKTFCEQPVIAYKLNWRGETYYSQNEVVPIRDDDDFDHFLTQVGDRTFYGVMEYGRYRGEFQRRLPAAVKNQACVVYNRNLKFVLAKVPCAKDDPERAETQGPSPGGKAAD